jgi:hypothetical protein
MTPDDFRAMALSLPDTIESSHMDHPDFRVRGKIFATLGYPDREWGVVGLTPEDQARVCKAEPSVFVPVKGAWGRAGSTQVHLDGARATSVRAALKAAWTHRVEKKKPALRRRKKTPARPRSR